MSNIPYETTQEIGHPNLSVYNLKLSTDRIASSDNCLYFVHNGMEYSTLNLFCLRQKLPAFDYFKIFGKFIVKCPLPFIIIKS